MQEQEVPRVLVAEDDRRLAAMLAELLQAEGYEVVLAHDGQRALHEGLTQQFDVMVFDRGLPVMEGLDVLSKLRGSGVVTPALVLSALGNPADRVEGLNRGAEDYLAKPFDVDELLARLRVLRRRLLSTAPVLRVPGGRLDPERREVTTDSGSTLTLSEREADLLGLLARHPHQIFSREDLMAAVFADADESGVVDTYVHYVRKKLGRGCILTVRGIGYGIGRTS
jgi:DNA-binding response OmpR family regulator